MGSLLAEEHFESGDPGFVAELRRANLGKKGRGFAERWYKDGRPWARLQIHEYLDGPLDCGGHEPLVKRLFKLAEEAGDDRTMAHFMTALDRTVRRTLVKVVDGYIVRYDHARAVEKLRSLRGGHPFLFSVHTRAYLRRRAWRYFRRLGRKDPKRYVGAAALALTRYRDADMRKGENLLDCWGLVHVMFHRHPALRSLRGGWTLAPGAALSSLAPAPIYPDAWDGGTLVALLLNARSRTVRWWAHEMLVKSGVEVPIETILSMLDHAEEDVQALGADLFSKAKGLDTLPLGTWMRLLELRNPAALDLICEAMRKAVAPDRLTFEQCAELACGPAGTVAKLGLEWLKARRVGPAEAPMVLKLANARAAVIGREVVAWARQALAQARPEDALAFLDSPNAEIRAAAWEWFAEKFASETPMWGRLFESPYDDVRLNLVGMLQFRVGEGPLRLETAELMWGSVLLNIHRGGRRKAHVLSQLARAAVAGAHPPERLLPLMSVALRSVRAPERRAGLAAVISIAERKPELAELVRKNFPELQWS
jgi:hypothetical protein